MQKELIVSAKSVDLAIEQACAQINMEKEDVQVEIINLPEKGLFGKIKVEAKVKVSYDDGTKEPVKPKPAMAPKKAAPPKTTAKKPAYSAPRKEDNRPRRDEKPCSPEIAEKKVEAGKKYILDITKAMGIGIESIETKPKENGTILLLKGADLGALIGRRGETIDAIQYLVSLVCNRIDPSYHRITIDCGNFREKREETLIELANKLAKTVLKTGRNCTLEPMNPYERRIIHSVVSDIEGINSRSIGEEPFRKIILSSKNSPIRTNNNRRRENSNRSNNTQPRDNKGYNSGRSDFKREDRKTTLPKTTEETQKRDKLSDNDSSLYSKIEL